MVTLATGAAPGRRNVELSGSVTGVGTANAAFLLGQFLGQRKHNVFPIRSDVLSMGEIAMGDVIFVGPTVGKPQIQAIPPVDPAFILTPEGVKIVKPAPGEQAFLKDEVLKGTQGGQDIEESHALISNLPGLYGNGSILYFEGNQVASVMGAVQAITDPDLAAQLVARLKHAECEIAPVLPGRPASSRDGRDPRGHLLCFPSGTDDFQAPARGPRFTLKATGSP